MSLDLDLVPIPRAPPPSHIPLSLLSTLSLKSLPASTPKQSRCIVQSLRKLMQMPGRKNILKRLDYDKIKTVEIEFLPPTYNGDVFFVLSTVGTFASYFEARFIFGMDKRYNGHV